MKNRACGRGRDTVATEWEFQVPTYLVQNRRTGLARFCSARRHPSSPRQGGPTQSAPACACTHRAIKNTGVIKSQSRGATRHGPGEKFCILRFVVSFDYSIEEFQSFKEVFPAICAGLRKHNRETEDVARIAWTQFHELSAVHQFFFV